jgi:hypothetical protein
MCFVSRLLRAILVGVVLSYPVLEDLVKLTYNSDILNSKHVYVNENGPFWPEAHAGLKSIIVRLRCFWGISEVPGGT